ncbi:acyl-CoA synthetase [compost metagenome]
MNPRILAAPWLASRMTCRGLRWPSQCARVLALLLQSVADAGSAPLQKIQLRGWLLAVLLIVLPKTSTGKIQKFVLRERARSATAIN